jgi:hypothetical protein
MEKESQEYLDQMEYYYQKAVELMSIPLAAYDLDVSVEFIEEAVELHKNGFFDKKEEDEKDV